MACQLDWIRKAAGAPGVLELGRLLQPASHPCGKVRKGSGTESSGWSMPCVGLLPSGGRQVREQSVCEAGETTSARLLCVPVESIVWLLLWFSRGVDGKREEPTPPPKPLVQWQRCYHVHYETEELQLREAKLLPKVTQQWMAALSTQPS